MAPSPPRTPTRGDGIPYTMRPASPIPFQHQNPLPSPPESNKSGNNNKQQDQEDPCKSSDESSLGASDTAREVDDLELAVKTINNLYRGHYPLKDNVTFTLRKSSYDVLHRRLDSDVLNYFDNEVRSSWYPDTDTGKLTIQAMPTTIHEKTLEVLRVDFYDKLNEIAKASNGALQPFRDSLEGAGSADIGKKKDSSSGYKSPDWQLEYDEWGTTFVLEVAYTQKQDNVESTASKYFDIEPSVRTVLVINITDRPEKERLEGCKHRAAFSLWTKECGKKPLVRNTVFREDDGHVFPGTLKIPFGFLLPPELTEHPEIRGAELTFSYESLAKFVQKAEVSERKSLKRRQGDAEAEGKDDECVTTSNDQPTLLLQARRAVHDFYHHRQENDFTYNLRASSYQQLLEGLRADKLLRYFLEEARTDWIPDIGELTLRRTTTPEINAYRQGLRNVLKEALDKAAKVPKKHRNKLRIGHDTLIGVKEVINQAHFSPDAQVSCAETKTSPSTSPFIVEVIYAPETVKDRVEEYFLNMKSVWAILVIEVDQDTYRVSLWEAQESDNGEFNARTAPSPFLRKGKALSGELEIPFELFFPPDQRLINLRGKKLAINFEQLARVFNSQSDQVEFKIMPSSSKRRRISMADKDGDVFEGGEGQQKGKRSKVEDEKTKTTGRTRSETAAAGRPRESKASRGIE
ncbi:hypothetical protein EV127DRAFT_30978 [Xylaria flabelliformis]|nr:hypothetical protein EV127DRAFT_30978 [Xylaria flabelliformis]